MSPQKNKAVDEAIRIAQQSNMMRKHGAVIVDSRTDTVIASASNRGFCISKNTVFNSTTLQRNRCCSPLKGCSGQRPLQLPC